MNRLTLILSLLVVGISLFAFAGVSSSSLDKKFYDNSGYNTDAMRAEYMSKHSLYCCIGLAGMLSTILGFAGILLAIAPYCPSSSHYGEVQISGKNEYGQSVKVWIKVK